MLSTVILQPEGIVFDIQRCSMHDGPGIRTTVFLKGCPLSCRWCHNPESQNPLPEETLLSEKIYGWRTDVSTLMNTITKDRPYYLETGGGLTVSGGEPFYQPGFLLALLKAAKQENIHTCVETSGFVSRPVLAAVMPYIDLFLLDYKVTSPQLHKAYTGADNELILDNLRFLQEIHKEVLLRCPVIPGCNDTNEHFYGIAGIEKSYPLLLGIEILPYHDFGRSKAAELGKTYEISPPTTDSHTKKRWKQQMKACGCSTQILSSF